MLLRHKTMFAVVSAGVWGRNSLNNSCGYRVLLLPCVTHSSCSLPTCLCLSEKRRKLRLFCGAQVFFSLLLSSVTRTSRSLCACLRLTEKRWKIAPVLQIQASSMKLRVHGFLFLVFLHIKTDGKNKPFFYNDINIQIRRFFSDLAESKSCGKHCLIIIRIGTNTAFLVFSLGIWVNDY